MMEDRTYPDYPIPGVGAIVIGKQGLLLHRRIKDPSKGLWSIPGGVIELGETQQETLLREVEEETGIIVEIIEMLTTYDLIVNDSQNRVKYHYVIIYYLTRALSSDIRPESPDGEVRWFSLKEIAGIDIPPQLLDLIMKNSQKIASIQV